MEIAYLVLLLALNVHNNNATPVVLISTFQTEAVLLKLFLFSIPSQFSLLLGITQQSTLQITLKGLLQIHSTI